MPRAATYRPRGSAIGHFIACSYRAALDRAVSTGDIELDESMQAIVEASKQSSPYADLGTVIHWHAQVGLGAAFHMKSADEAKYSPEQLENAAGLFKRDTNAALSAANAAAKLLIAAIGRPPGGRQWIAERMVQRPWVKGHIDLLDMEAGELVDIKSTSRPPHYSRLPPSHLAQTLAYARACMELKIPIKRVRVVYVDSQAAQWYLPCEYDPTTDAMMEYGDMLIAYAKRLQSKSYQKHAMPNLGHACEEWCPYTSLCRDRYHVEKGDIKKVDLPKVIGVNPLGGMRAS